MSENRDLAWSYYQHADNLQHQRHNIFVVTQSIFFAAFAQAPDYVAYVLIIVGIFYAILWSRASERMSDGMAAISRKYIEPGNEVYTDYLLGLDRKIRTSGRTTMNLLIPGTMGSAWLVLAVVKLAA